MKKITTLFFLIIVSQFSFTQNIDTVKFSKNLKILNRYDTKSEGSYSSTNGGEISYKMDGKLVDKKTYLKYHPPFKEYMNCCPCLIQNFDLNENLIKQSVRCGECVSGWWIEYFPDGKIKVIGKYEDNPTDNWDNIWSKGFCGLKIGEWKYFFENGTKSYSEFWSKGEFIEQVPLQDSIEILTIELVFNGAKLDSKEINIDEIKDLKVIATYKNKNHDPNLKIQSVINVVGFKGFISDSLYTSFTDIDISKSFASIGVPLEKRKRVDFKIFIDNRFVAYFSVNLKK